MTDRELLELAAKAAGIELGWGIYERGFLIEPISKCFHRTETGRRKEWNPLTDDGDVLRLAVSLLRLGRSVHLDIYAHAVNARLYPEEFGKPPIEARCWTNRAAQGATDIYDVDEATRRAIVLAAAEAGKGMP